MGRRPTHLFWLKTPTLPSSRFKRVEHAFQNDARHRRRRSRQRCARSYNFCRGLGLLSNPIWCTCQPTFLSHYYDHIMQQELCPLSISTITRGLSKVFHALRTNDNGDLAIGY